MVKTSELRLGNWLQQGNKNDKLDIYYIGEVLEIYFDESIEYSYDGASNGISKTDCDKLDGILINEEILFKIGFRPTEETMIFGYKNYIFDLDKMTLCREISSGAGCVHDRDIKYVHELQNLYWWVTGEELTFIL